MKQTLLVLGTLLISSTILAQTGGPDLFGYTYISSDAPGGPTYSWIEIDTNQGGNGTWSTTSDVDDYYEGNIPLSFNFPFYGKSYSTISISSNGAVFFANLNLSWANVCMPGDPAYSFVADTAFIAPIWGDLTPNGSGDIYYQDFGNYFVVEFSNVTGNGSLDGDTWEVVLHSNGDIKMQFKDASNLSVDAFFTTGIQGSPTLGLGYQCFGGGDAISDSLIILWQGPITEIKEIIKPELVIFPNPNNGEFNILTQGINTEFSIKITDMGGRVVYSSTKQISSNTVSLENVERGIYILSVTSGSTRYVSTLIIE